MTRLTMPITAILDSDPVLEAIFATSGDSVLLIDPETALPVRFNTHAYTELGYTREEFKEIPIWQYEASKDVEVIKHRIKKVIEEKYIKFQTQHKTKAGKVIDVFVTGQLFQIKGYNLLFVIFENNTQELLLKAKYSKTFEKANIGIAHVAPNGDFLDVNQRWSKILGYQADELANLSFQKLTLPEDLETDLELLRKILNNEIQTFNKEKRYFHKNGNIIWVNLTVALNRKSDGTPDFLISIIDDITEKIASQERIASKTEAFGLEVKRRKEIERKLKLQEKAFKEAQSLSKIGHWQYDLVQNVLTWSDETYHIFELSRGQLTPTYELFLDAIDPGDRDKVNEAFSDSLKDKSLYEVTHRLNFTDGRVKYVKETCHTKFDEQGKPLVSLGTTQDITEEYLLREGLEFEKNRYSSLFSNMINGFAVHELVTDEYNNPIDYIFLEINESFTDLTGLTPEMCIGKKVTSIIPGIENDPADWIGKYGDVALGGERLSFENFAEGLGKWFSIHAFSPKLGQFATVFQDISKEKSYQESLMAAKFQAEAANTAKSNFLNMMSHELRTPMNGVLGMAQLLELANIDEKYKEFARIIITSGNSLVNILSDILDLSKIEAGQQEVVLGPFSLKETIESICDLYLGSAIKKGIELSCSLPIGIADIFIGDSNLLKRILINLVHNGIKFTDSGSVVIAVTALESVKDSQILQFTITDTGVGILGEKIDLIFNPFQQADDSATRKFGGTGLGLAIVKDLVGILNGSISVDSTVGQGSCFTVELPFTTTPSLLAENPSEKENSNGVLEIPKRKALLAEDDLINQTVIKTMLSHLNITCDIANDGIEAVALASKTKYDVIFMDILMPNLDGYEATAKIKTIGSKNHMTPIIALTAMASQSDQQKCKDVGMSDFLSKPISLVLLEEAIKKAFELS
ncbi:MAG: PAS domain S-box protein [SAR324 cluster bacterium]|nr:PAS domain S-box protein [SAR324 cluster bacterium]